jgi:hypothetical protein
MTPLEAQVHKDPELYLIRIDRDDIHIDNGNLIYASFVAGNHKGCARFHGAQCNWVGGTPEHDRIFKLCDEIADRIMEIHRINNSDKADHVKEEKKQQDQP